MGGGFVIWRMPPHLLALYVVDFGEKRYRTFLSVRPLHWTCILPPPLDSNSITHSGRVVAPRLVRSTKAVWLGLPSVRRSLLVPFSRCFGRVSSNRNGCATA